jgi:hypothetical protein
MKVIRGESVPSRHLVGERRSRSDAKRPLKEILGLFKRAPLRSLVFHPAPRCHPLSLLNTDLYPKIEQMRGSYRAICLSCLLP